MRHAPMLMSAALVAVLSLLACSAEEDIGGGLGPDPSRPETVVGVTNGTTQIDLTQAEAVAAVINAGTAARPS